MILCCTELSKFHLVGCQFSFFVDYENFQENKCFHHKYGNRILEISKPGSKVRHTCFSYWLQFRLKKIGNPLKPPRPQTSLAVLWNYTFQRLTLHFWNKENWLFFKSISSLKFSFPRYSNKITSYTPDPITNSKTTNAEFSQPF